MRLLPVTIMVACAALVACESNKNETIDDIGDTKQFPTMLTTDVSTFISDSGYTRYHITAPLWEMYEEADTPYWDFPDGLELEKYDDDMNSISTFQSNRARYFSAIKKWHFEGNVNMSNVDGDRFATPELYWDQRDRRVYSDSFMHIERAERIIEGYGFESNEQMTQYTVLKPQMILPVDRMRQESRERQDSVASDTTSVSTSTDRTIPRSRRAPRPQPIMAKDVYVDNSDNQ